ncbi:MAG: hypothetical protein M2R45_01979 [Verrucomicrobia subdivision 3 bacterium]|nr:hypothetical protein [Limisphaerales bacterium]MCS1416154.1 hypothetical protein [Limisphaerales bacterium]
MRSTQTKSLWPLLAIVFIGHSLIADMMAKPVSFADNGGLKRLYMYPQAFATEETLFIVWRGYKGFPCITIYDFKTQQLSEHFNELP